MLTRLAGHSGLSSRFCGLVQRVVLLVAVILLGGAARADAFSFTDVTEAAGLATTHGYFEENVYVYVEPGVVAGGVAAGDFDRDGFVDLFLVRGDLGPAHLFRNRGDGTFIDVATSAGVDLAPGRYSSATFADVDGDGWRDLIVVGFGGTQPILFRNQGNGTFTDVTSTSGLVLPGMNSFSASFGDYDRDGDLDLFLSRWLSQFTIPGSGGQLWRNDGTGTFTDVSVEAGIPLFTTRLVEIPDVDLSFAGNFADIDSDGWLDLLVSADFQGSRVLRNQGDGTFVDVTDTDVIDDENGMGSAIGDYDNDGDLDWFVSSISDPDGVVEGNWGSSGNRLYRNDGTGTFSDVTDLAGVRTGFWGWGATFADLNNDTHPDLIHVNGWGPVADDESEDFHADPARCFLADGDGTFTESAELLGIADTGQGRGVVAFDYDRDGDIDLFITNNNGTPRLYRNDGGNAMPHLGVKLRAADGIRQAIGGRIRATIGDTTQMRELRAGTNFESQNPSEAHFGLGAATAVDELRISWPSGVETVLADMQGGRTVVVSEPWTGMENCTGDAAGNGCISGGGSVADCLLETRISPLPLDPRGRTVRCRDGDAACDADGMADGACTFGLSLCINNQDPRLDKCSPSDVQRLEITAPRKTSRKELERNVHALLRDAFGPNGDLALSEHSVLANVSRDYCTTPVDVAVPLTVSATGSVRSTRLRLGFKARSSDRRSDSDVVAFQCLPGLPETQLADESAVEPAGAASAEDLTLLEPAAAEGSAG